MCNYIISNLIEMSESNKARINLQELSEDNKARLNGGSNFNINNTGKVKFDKLQCQN